MLSFVKLPVVDFDNVGHNDQLKKPGESVGAELQPKVFMIQINLEISRKDVGER
jgi:hypothetical protein